MGVIPEGEIKDMMERSKSQISAIIEFINLD